MVQAQRPYTKHTSTEIARCVGCLCTSAGWFKHIEPHRTYTNHTITELARCVGCLGTRSGWFKHSEPHRTYTNHPALVPKHPTPLWDGVVRVGSLCLNHPEVGLARGGSSTANLSEPKNPITLESTKGLVVCLKVISRDSFTFVRKRASKVSRVLLHKSGVVQAQRTSSNLHEPHQHRASKVCRVLLH